MRKRVVITGCGLVSPLGMRVEEAWRRLCRGESGIRSLTGESFASFPSRIAGLCDDFTTVGYLEPKEVRRLDRFAQFAVTAGTDAIRQSGVDFSRCDPFRIGAIVGSGVGGLDELERQQDRLRALGASKVSPFTIPKIISNSAAAQLAIMYGLHGPSYSVSTACASANNAMADAFRLITLGDLDVVVTGGAEAAATPLGFAGFCALRALSERNDDPMGASRPFDRRRDGFVLSEGAGILVFEELEHAKRRGANILAEMCGAGVTTDACHVTQPDKEGLFASAALSATLRSAGWNPHDVDYINLHGTSTQQGDVAEVEAIKRAFGDSASRLSLSSTKSQIGHLLGGSGGVEAIFTLLTIRDGIVPPTINLTDPDPACDLDFTPQVAKEKRVTRAVSNSFGFGGHNACVALKRFDG